MELFGNTGVTLNRATSQHVLFNIIGLLIFRDANTRMVKKEKTIKNRKNSVIYHLTKACAIMLQLTGYSL